MLDTSLGSIPIDQANQLSLWAAYIWSIIVQFMEERESTKCKNESCFPTTSQVIERSLFGLWLLWLILDAATEMMVCLGFVIDCRRTSCFETQDIVTQANDGEKINYNTADRLTTECVSSPKELWLFIPACLGKQKSRTPYKEDRVRDYASL